MADNTYAIERNAPSYSSESKVVERYASGTNIWKRMKEVVFARCGLWGYSVEQSTPGGRRSLIISW